MTGSASVTTSGGTAPYTYSWSNGAMTEDIMGVGAGMYTLTVTDAGGCVSTFSTTVLEPAALNPGAPSKGDVSCNAGSDGFIALSVTGGTPPYTYTWDSAPPQTGSTAGSLPAGTFTCTILDNNGCMTTLTESLTEPTAIVLVTDSVDTGGGVTGEASVVASGGTPPYSYSWSTGEVTSSIAGKPAGMYAVIVTDGNGCTSTANITINMILGIADDLAAGVSHMQTYPNPTSSDLSVLISLTERNEVTLFVTDMWGRSFLKQNLPQAVDHDVKLSLENLPTGIYLLRVETVNGNTTRRIVKQ